MEETTSTEGKEKERLRQKGWRKRVEREGKRGPLDQNWRKPTAHHLRCKMREDMK